MEENEEILQLREEVEKLRNLLDRTEKDKHKAAEYGLVVLEEKQALQSQCENLENQLESSQLELKLTKDTLCQLQGSMRKANETGLTYEQVLLQDEEVLRGSLNQTEADLRSCQHLNQTISKENEKHQSKINELMAKIDDLEQLKLSLRGELREMKAKEAQLSSDFADLEEENVSLQKQMMTLRENQVSFETIKLDNSHLKDLLEELQQELSNVEKLKEISEQNLNESLEHLRREREEKHHLKKELDQRISNDSSQALSLITKQFGIKKSKESNNQNDKNNSESKNKQEENTFSNSKNCKFKLSCEDLLTNNEGEDENRREEFYEDDENPALRKVEADLASHSSTSSLGVEGGDNNNLIGDLFNEIHIAEVKKLEKVIVKLEEEKEEVEEKLEDLNNQIKGSLQQKLQAEGEAKEVKENLEKFKKNYLEFQGNSDELKKLTQNFDSYEKAIKQIQQLEQQKQQSNNNSERLAKTQQSQDDDIVIRKLETEIEDKKDMVRELTNVLSTTTANFRLLSKDLSGLYNSMCIVRREAPNKKILEFEKNKNYLESSDNSVVTDSPYISCGNLCSFVSVQVSTMNEMMMRMVEVEREKQLSFGEEERMQTVVELKEEIGKLKSMLSTKKEQIATLRNVLKSNKNTAETALATLKQKVESDRASSHMEFQKLRAEVKMLKEEKATFSSLRASFAQRCDEYLTQMDELQTQLIRAEEEKKTLNSLLKMAVLEKIQTNNKLEALTNKFKMLKFPRQLVPPQNGPSFFSNPPLSHDKFIPPPRFQQQKRDF